MSAKIKLHNLKNVNTVLSMLYDKDGNRISSNGLAKIMSSIMRFY